MLCHKTILYEMEEAVGYLQAVVEVYAAAAAMDKEASYDCLEKPLLIRSGRVPRALPVGICEVNKNMALRCISMVPAFAL